jgi:hypothetical protein
MSNRKPIEAPEKIMIDDSGIIWINETNEGIAQVYIRADKYAELEKKLEIAVEALENIESNMSDKRELARIALNQITGETDEV